MSRSPPPRSRARPPGRSAAVKVYIARLQLPEPGLRQYAWPSWSPGHNRRPHPDRQRPPTGQPLHRDHGAPGTRHPRRTRVPGSPSRISTRCHNVRRERAEHREHGRRQRDRRLRWDAVGVPESGSAERQDDERREHQRGAVAELAGFRFLEIGHRIVVLERAERAGQRRDEVPQPEADAVEGSVAVRPTETSTTQPTAEPSRAWCAASTTVSLEKKRLRTGTPASAARPIVIVTKVIGMRLRSAPLRV